MYAIGSIFIAFNILLLVVTAMPHDAGTIPRFYWAVMVAAIIAVAGAYWSAIKVLQTRIGRLIGFQVKVYEHLREEEIPDSLRALWKRAVDDGSNRRLSYKVLPSVQRLVAMANSEAD